MKRGQDLAVTFPGLYLVHQNLPGKEVEPHAHAEHLLFVPLQGEIEVRHAGGVLKAGPGQMVYLPPHTPHSFRSSTTQGERLIGLISPKAWRTAKVPVPGVGLIAASQLCKEILFYLLLHPSTKHAESLLLTLIQTLGESIEASCHLLDTVHIEAKVRDARVRRVLSYFEENLGETVSMTAAAKIAGLSVRSMNRLFSTDLGLTPKQVLSQFRVEKARTLLLRGNVSVTEAAFEVGYQSLTQFISVFQKLTGQLPSEVARHGLAEKR